MHWTTSFFNSLTSFLSSPINLSLSLMLESSFVFCFWTFLICYSLASSANFCVSVNSIITSLLCLMVPSNSLIVSSSVLIYDLNSSLTLSIYFKFYSDFFNYCCNSLSFYSFAWSLPLNKFYVSFSLDSFYSLIKTFFSWMVCSNLAI